MRNRCKSSCPRNISSFRGWLPPRNLLTICFSLNWKVFVSQQRTRWLGTSWQGDRSGGKPPLGFLCSLCAKPYYVSFLPVSRWQRPSGGGTSAGSCVRSPGMSELEEGLLAGEIDLDEKQVDSGSGMSLSVAQPLVREWLAKRRANLRPVGTFFNTANFQVRMVMWRCRLLWHLHLWLQRNYIGVQ